MKARELEEKALRAAEEAVPETMDMGTQPSSSFLSSIKEDQEEDFADEVIEAAEDLPPGWRKQVFADGKSFYINMITNKGQLMKPTDAAKADFSSSDAMIAELMASSQTKTVNRQQGHLQKKTGFLSLWKKCYMVLNVDLLDEYASHSAYCSGVPARSQMILTSESDVAYDHSHLCFTVTTGKLKWRLMAENMWELRHWTNALASVIGKLYDDKIKSLGKKK